jgi:hypothetical protein
MAMTIQQISPVAHLPLVLGVVRQLNAAVLIDIFCPPHSAPVLSCGRGVEALVLAIRDGHHALSKVGARLEERGMFPLLQPGLQRASLHDDRRGQILDALCAATLNRVFGAIALKALEVYALTPPWLHQEATTITLYGAYAEEARPVQGPVPPRPAYGHSTDGHDDLKQVLLSLGVSSDGLPLRMGLRDGTTSDSTETPVAIEACVALGLNGVHGIVADRKAYGQRTLGLCLEQGVGLITLVPRTCAVRQEDGDAGPASCQRMMLPVADFLQRWLHHVPVPQTRVVRCYGLYHHTPMEALALCRAHLGQPPVAVPELLGWQTACAQRGEAQPERCPACGQLLVCIEVIPRGGAPPTVRAEARAA